MEMNIFALIIVLFLCCDTPKSQENKNGHVCGQPLGTEFRLEEDRIVAGYDIGYYRYPWYAALMRNGQVSCGGALIGPKTVLTAAHCFKEFLYLNKKGYLKLEPIFKIRLGVYNVCETENTQREFNIEKVQIHEDYAKKKPYYDICLLTLADDTSAYEPICLPETELPKKPKDGTVPGLGTLKYQGIMPCTVHEARLLVYNDSICHQMIANTGNDANAITNAFCAGYIQGGIDTCQGDSGGPLQSMNANGYYTLLGIVSFGFQCAKPGLLGMYTDVSEYLDWIQEKSGLDAGIVDIIYNKTTTAIATTTPAAKKRAHKRRYYYGRPFRKPVRVIVLRHHRLQAMTKMMLHHPIIRNNSVTFND